jgi:hypothetical protein
MKQSIQRMRFACVYDQFRVFEKKVKDQRVKVMALNERSYKKEYTCEI